MVAFLLFGYLGAIKQGFSQGIDVAGVDRLIVRHKVSIIQLLPQSYESRIEQVDGVMTQCTRPGLAVFTRNPVIFSPRCR